MIAVVAARPHLGPGPPALAAAGPGAAAPMAASSSWLVPYALIGAGAIAFVVFGRRLQPRPRSRWLGGLIAIDLVVFTILGVVRGPCPAWAANPAWPGRGAARHGGQAAAAAGAAATDPPGRRAGRHRRPAPRPIAALGYPGRFAIYDPDQLAAHELPLLGAPDLNAISATPSVQGYTSLVDGFYASATGAHQAMGQGQDVLAPRAVGDRTLDQLNTSVLLTPSAYLITRPGIRARYAAARDRPPRHRSGPPRPPGTSPRRCGVSRLEVPDADARQDAAAGTRIGLMTRGRPTRWFTASAPSASRLAISLPHPVTGVAVVAPGRRGQRHLGPLSVTDTERERVRRQRAAAGRTRAAAVGIRLSHDGSFAVFADHLARGALSLQALPGRSSVRRVGAAGDGSAAVPERGRGVLPHGIRVVRSVTAIAGWSATWHPRRGPPAALAVEPSRPRPEPSTFRRASGVVTWSYAAAVVHGGLALSLVAAALILCWWSAGRWPTGPWAAGTGRGAFARCPAAAPVPGSGSSAPAGERCRVRIERMMVVIPSAPAGAG